MKEEIKEVVPPVKKEVVKTATPVVKAEAPVKEVVKAEVDLKPEAKKKAVADDSQYDYNNRPKAKPLAAK